MGLPVPRRRHLRQHGRPGVFDPRRIGEANRHLGFDVIGMTNLPEAKLAREAEIAMASVSFVTDYDCWKTEEEPVSVETVIGHLLANAETAKGILARVIPRLPTAADWPEHRVLDTAIITAQKRSGRKQRPERLGSNFGAVWRRCEGY